MSKILIVGAGFAGAVHARELAEAGHHVDIVDQRDHIAGNCFDYEHETGVRVHRYGPHLFHTSNTRVVDWLSRFTDWLPYEHEVAARLPDGRCVPMPVNLDTVNAVFGTELETPAEVAAALAERALPRDPIVSAEDHLFATIGRELTDLFFRPYTKKMWAMDLSETAAAVVQRLQIRTDRDGRYFPNDTFQAMPAQGYTRLFERILDHRRIAVSLRTPFTRGMEHGYDACFNSMPIDEYFEFAFGELPYRSIRFHLSEEPRATASPYATLNYTDAGPTTRETWWHNIAGHDMRGGDRVLKTVEEPCDYRDNACERYYPVKTSDGWYDAIYQRYKALAAENERMQFIGRCGTYQYLDMHQVINQSLANVHKWLGQKSMRDDEHKPEPRMLAVVRCGDKSLHREWASGGKLFDVAISYFGADEDRRFPEAAYLHRMVGGKWDGLFAFFQAYPETLERYDYFWFPDDDISAKAADVDALVRAGMHHHLDLFQPSLDRASYYSHLITLHHASFTLRYTNFVEIMVPVVSRRLLEQALPTMAETKSGFGLDFLWPQLADALPSGPAGRHCAVVDAVCVRHTRPVGGSLHAFMKKAGGRSSADELSAAVASSDVAPRSQINGVATPRIQIVAGVLGNGRTITGPRLMAAVALDLLVRGRNKVQSSKSFPVLRHALKAGLANAGV